MYFWYYLHFFFILTLKSSKQNLQLNIFYQKFVHLGEKTSEYCSRKIVVHVHATVQAYSHNTKEWEI